MKTKTQPELTSDSLYDLHSALLKMWHFTLFLIKSYCTCQDGSFSVTPNKEDSGFKKNGFQFQFV